MLNQVVGGWRLSAIQNYMSGAPVGISTSASIPGCFGGIWPVRAPGVAIRTISCGSYTNSSSYLNINAFQDPAPFTLGNLSEPGNLRACPFYNENFEIDKVFPISERLRVNFGSMFSNLFNRHILDSASGNVGWNIDQPATFGKFTFVDPPGPRAVEFFLRLEF